MTFQNTVLLIAFVLLIISLIIIGGLIRSATLSAKFPPETGKCPDYLVAELNGDKLQCSNPQLLGNGDCTGAFVPFEGTDSSAIISNCQAAKKCGLTWDGITNVQNNETGSPYC
jgi:hypothetical protein